MTQPKIKAKAVHHTPRGSHRAVKAAPVALDSKQDGTTHVNVFSRGKTELGIFLSNFSKTPFKHPTYGSFASMEGFWYYLSSGCKFEELRKLVGIDAKKFGKGLERVEVVDFEEKIKAAIEYKIEQYPLFKLKLAMNKLPLKHYFVFKGDVVVDQPQYAWQVKHIERLAAKWRLE